MVGKRPGRPIGFERRIQGADRNVGARDEPRQTPANPPAVSRALQIYYSGFNNVFLGLSPEIQRRIEARIDEMGTRLESFPHYRMKGGDRYRLRVGDYRVIYTFNADKREIHLLAVGHRREVYR
jgi:mRNA interferase RelE/StbE